MGRKLIRLISVVAAAACALVSFASNAQSSLGRSGAGLISSSTSKSQEVGTHSYEFNNSYEQAQQISDCLEKKPTCRADALPVSALNQAADSSSNNVTDKPGFWGKAGAAAIQLLRAVK